MPTIALGIGVVVAGLGIGAFLSALQHKETTKSTQTVSSAGAPLVTPVARSSRGPVAIATIVAHPTPTPRPTSAPSATPTPASTPRATASAKPRAVATGAPTKPAAPTVAVTAPSAPTPPAAPIAAPATPEPPRRRTPPPVVITPAPAPVVITPAPKRIAQAPAANGMAGEAQATVRRYINALVNGNESAAYAALGASPGDPNARLSEEAFVDHGTRIVSLRTNASDPSGATVEVELSSTRGTYFATYHVRSGPNGPVIDQHDYIRE